jgi:hypothetical protein
MKELALSFLLVAVLCFSACDVSESHVTANVPSKDDFRTFLVRDLTTYFQHHTYGNGITVDYELLRDEPTQVGVAYPKYYVWATITMPDKSIVEGAARVAAVAKREFHILAFFTRSEIITDPTELAQCFPKALLEKIRAKSGVKK